MLQAFNLTTQPGFRSTLSPLAGIAVYEGFYNVHFDSFTTPKNAEAVTRNSILTP